MPPLWASALLPPRAMRGGGSGPRPRPPPSPAAERGRGLGRAEGGHEEPQQLGGAPGRLRPAGAADHPLPPGEGRAAAGGVEPSPGGRRWGGSAVAAGEAGVTLGCIPAWHGSVRVWGSRWVAAGQAAPEGLGRCCGMGVLASAASPSEPPACPRAGGV